MGTGLLLLAGYVPDSEQVGSYFICATPRTGSTLLCGLLADAGLAGKPESYFRLRDERSYAESWSVPVGTGGPHDYREYARAALAAGRTTNGVFAARVMWGTMAEVVAKLRGTYRSSNGTDLDVLEQAFGPARFVHLQRGDVLAQAVSWARAEQTDQWQDGDSGAEQLPKFDSSEIDGYLRTINVHNAAWRGWFGSSGIAPLGVTYEDLIADMSGTVAVILRFLGLELPVDHIVEARTRRQADEVNKDWVNRCRALGLGGP